MVKLDALVKIERFPLYDLKTFTSLLKFYKTNYNEVKACHFEKGGRYGNLKGRLSHLSSIFHLKNDRMTFLGMETCLENIWLI